MIAVDAVNEGDAGPVLGELHRRPEDPANLQLLLQNDPFQVGLKQCEKKENKMNDFGKVVSCNNEPNSSIVIGNLGFRPKFRFQYAFRFRYHYIFRFRPKFRFEIVLLKTISVSVCYVFRFRYQFRPNRNFGISVSVDHYSSILIVKTFYNEQVIFQNSNFRRFWKWDFFFNWPNCSVDIGSW